MCDSKRVKVLESTYCTVQGLYQIISMLISCLHTFAAAVGLWPSKAASVTDKLVNPKMTQCCLLRESGLVVLPSLLYMKNLTLYTKNY